MSDALLLILVFGGLIAGIWLTYRLFMAGDTNAERVASRLPPGFKADWSWRHGDTYAGYDTSSDRMALVDFPHGTVVAAGEVQSAEPVDENVLGLVHRWVVVTVPRTPAKYRIWFGLSTAKRDEFLARLNTCRTSAGSPSYRSSS